MATIKAYTDLEQSKKLAEILPLESADMRIGNYIGESGKVDGTNVHYYPKGESFGAPEIICAWSLAALLSVLPNGIVMNKDSQNGMYHFSSKYVGTSVTADNPVDACVEIVTRLHELNLL